MIRAALLILEKEGKVLFALRAKKRESLPDKWSLPSEKIEEGETLEQATTRCAKHELSLSIKDPKIFDEYHFKDSKEDKILYFMKATYEGEPRISAPEEVVKLERHTLEEFFAKYPDEEIGHGLQYLRKKLGYNK